MAPDEHTEFPPFQNQADTAGNYDRCNYVYPVTISSADFEPEKPKPDPKKRIPFYREFLNKRKKR